MPTTKNSTTVRFETQPSPLGAFPKMLTTALRLAPFLQRPVLTRLFLTPVRKKKRAPARFGVVLGRIRVAEREILVRAEGRGPVVLFVHGWQGESGHLSCLARSVTRQGFTAVTFDMPAHGETKGNKTSIGEFISTIEEVAKFVGPLHSIVAHSLGATAAALALRRGLAAQSAVLIAPMISFDFALDEFSKMLGLDEKLREKTARGAESEVGITREEANLGNFSLDACPLLLVHDEDDRRTPYGYTALLHDHWRGSSLLKTEKLGHRRILEDQAVGEKISHFVGATPRETSDPLEFHLVPEMGL